MATLVAIMVATLKCKDLIKCMNKAGPDQFMIDIIKKNTTEINL